MVEHDDWIAARTVLVDPERPAHCWLDTERVEQIAAHRDPECPACNIVWPCGKRRNDEPIGDEARKALRLVANVDVVGIRQRRTLRRGEAGTWHDGSHRHDLAGSRQGERTQHQRVRHAEHRSIGADANGD